MRACEDWLMKVSYCGPDTWTRCRRQLQNTRESHKCEDYELPMFHNADYTLWSPLGAVTFSTTLITFKQHTHRRLNRSGTDS
jgi:hypothetical protein